MLLLREGQDAGLVQATGIPISVWDIPLARPLARGAWKTPTQSLGPTAELPLLGGAHMSPHAGHSHALPSGDYAAPPAPQACSE